MNKSLFVVIAALGLSYFAVAAPKDQSWNGWVSETACGAKGANAQHAGCAKKCIANERSLYWSRIKTRRC